MGRPLGYDPEKEYKDCATCGKRVYRIELRTRLGRKEWERKTFCSRSCGGFRARQGEKHPNWKGGRHISSKGYVQVRISAEHPFASMRRHSYVLEHRLVMAEHLGRPLLRSEGVHHRDGNRQNNALANLELRARAHGAGATHAHCPTCTCFAH